MDIGLIRKIVIYGIVGCIAHSIFGPVGLAVVILIGVLRETKKGES